MVDVEKRYFGKPWFTPNNTQMMKHRFYDSHLPPLKPVGEPPKQPTLRPSKRRGSTILPPLTRNLPLGSTVTNGSLVSLSSNIDTSPSTTTLNSQVHEAAQRFILRNSMAKLSHDLPSANMPSDLYQRRKTLYAHIPAKVDTGLPRTGHLHGPECDTHQLEPTRPINWSKLKHELGQDIQIRAHTKRMQVNSNVTYTTQLSTLADLLRSKVKTHLSALNGGGDERYKIVVNLTVFSNTCCGITCCIQMFMGYRNR